VRIWSPTSPSLGMYETGTFMGGQHHDKCQALAINSVAARNTCLTLELGKFGQIPDVTSPADGLAIADIAVAKLTVLPLDPAGRPISKHRKSVTHKVIRLCEMFPLDQSVLVGRLDELARLRDDLMAARSGQPRIVCVVGAPGVGKTALINTFSDGASDATFLQASGDEEEADRTWGVLRQLAAAPVAQGVPEFENLARTSGNSSGQAVGAALLKALTALQRERPVVVAVEDVQWSDAPSAAALRFAARRLNADRVLVLVTARPGRSGDRAEAWIRLSEERGRRIRLGGLRSEDLLALAATVGISLTPRAAHRLWQHTEGHPRHALAILERWEAESFESTTATLPASWSPAGGRQQAALRFGQAPGASGRPEGGCHRVLGACEVALDVGDLISVEAKLDELEQMDGPRRDLVLARVALLRDRIREAQGLMDSAWRLVERGSLARSSLAASIAVYQGMLALARLSSEEALTWAATSVRPGAGGAPPLGVAVGNLALGYAGRGAEALASSADDTGTELDPTRAGELAVRAMLRLVTDDLGGANRDLNTIQEHLGLGPQPQAELTTLAPCTLAQVHYRRGELEAAVTAAELAVVMAEDSGAAAALATAHSNAVWPLAAQGNWERAEAHLRTARARVAESPAARLSIAAAAWALASARGDARTMLEAARDFYAVGRLAEPGFYPFGPLLAEPLVLLGRVDEALPDLEAFEREARRRGRLSAQLTAARVRGLLEEARGDQDAAGHTFGMGLTLARALPFRLEEARLQAASGASLLRSGKRRIGRAQLEEARSRMTEMGASAYAARLESVEADRTPARGGRAADGLTRAEAAVVELVMSGLSNAEVAGRLVVTRKAVEYHLTNVYAKLGISSRTQLILRLGSGVSA
jgi:DNA-binding CsgD family transcriptional regulator/tetratricopeptide (TPR) repeat protein